ncbi:alpha/beta hydrolase [Solitalea sp. MAHUQ-68]|uniref:Alpha/beta hydrolase n=1 Tax=Solitalea agri TaxID=2953739 RepID=A0A9X2JD91_9SPHI|nr:alpha/beta hydrolase [Solitalea agri]MCO4293364.1 alpha/beta hydrolase [Solitalea agri]
MKTPLHLSPLYLSFFLMSSCSQMSRTDATSEMSVQIVENLSYGNDPEQKVDILLPSMRNDQTKVMLFLHGGSWKKGDKSDYTPALKAFAQRGFVIVNMNYRLAEKNKNKFPVQMDDITAVINMLDKRSHEWGFGLKNIGISGHSAGAHLALLYSYHFNKTGKVKAVAALAPVSDLTDAGRLGNAEYQNPIANFLGKKFLQDSTLWAAASPYWMVTAGAVPTLLFHGTEDRVVPINQSAKLEKRLESLNVPSKFIKYDAGHVWLGADLRDTRDNVIKWMNTYLN